VIRAPESDFWQVGIVPAAIGAVLDPAVLAGLRKQIVWLPDPGSWRYLADPFALRRGNVTHVFVEAFDYRTKHATIECHDLGPGLAWQRKQTVLARPFHLSYPFVFEHDGEAFMIPESHRHQEIALYRARQFPGDWVRETALLSGVRGAEASVLRHAGRWWMFFTIVGPDARDQRELHLAYADQLTGPWTRHAGNPVVESLAGARPGGTPFVDHTGCVVLPVQDCSATYGGAIRLLRFAMLTPDKVEVAALPHRLSGDLVSDTHRDGLHTLSACGDLTLIDAKQIRRSHARRWIDLQRRAARLWRSARRPAGTTDA
jgi:hypothetical protein